MLAQNSTAARNPVVVELFTSEGCSSCPPADRLLARLQSQHTLAGAELILLGEHVDYWNDLGWKDRFAQHSFTERQEQYGRTLPAQVYTPQMVVDGHIDVAGNDDSAVERSITTAAKTEKAARVKLNWSAPDQLGVAVDGAEAHAGVLLFITEDNLSTQVKSGENGGTTLHHAAVVRELRRLGETTNSSFQQSVKLTLDPQWQKLALRAIVLVQQQRSEKILGASALPMQQ
jgi:hypothetical protein